MDKSNWIVNDNSSRLLRNDNCKSADIMVNAEMYIPTTNICTTNICATTCTTNIS